MSSIVKILRAQRETRLKQGHIFPPMALSWLHDEGGSLYGGFTKQGAGEWRYHLDSISAIHPGGGWLTHILDELESDSYPVRVACVFNVRLVVYLVKRGYEIVDQYNYVNPSFERSGK